MRHYYLFSTEANPQTGRRKWPSARTSFRKIHDVTPHENTICLIERTMDRTMKIKFQTSITLHQEHARKKTQGNYRGRYIKKVWRYSRVRTINKQTWYLILYSNTCHVFNIQIYNRFNPDKSENQQTYQQQLTDVLNDRKLFETGGNKETVRGRDGYLLRSSDRDDERRATSTLERDFKDSYESLWKKSSSLGNQQNNQNNFKKRTPQPKI